MNLQPVPIAQSGSLKFACVKCGDIVWQSVDTPVFADLDGEPFIDYYCHHCAETLKREATR